MHDFASLSAIITGGASGIGAAIANRLAEGGAMVAVLDPMQGRQSTSLSPPMFPATPPYGQRSLPSTRSSGVST